MDKKRMDVIAYKESGILQDYCLGLLTKEAEREVEAMCEAHPDVAAELESLRLALEKYASSNRMEHKVDLRSRIWGAIKRPDDL